MIESTGAKTAQRRWWGIALVDGAPRITQEVADRALALLEVDDLGLEVLDRNYLECLVNTFEGGPVGLSTLAVSLGEETDTLEDVVEPFLIQQGYIARTARGRMATSRAYRLFGLEAPGEAPGRAGRDDLFAGK